MPQLFRWCIQIIAIWTPAGQFLSLNTFKVARNSPFQISNITHVADIVFYVHSAPKGVYSFGPSKSTT